MATSRAELRAATTNALVVRRCLALAGPPLIAAAGLVWLEGTDADRTIASWFFDPVSHSFPLRHDRLLEVVLHHWAKYLVIMLGALAVAGFLLSFCIDALRPHRRVWLFLALSLSLAPLAVTALKAASDKHCPWSLAQFGGYLPYVRLFETAPPGLEPGHCFPAGHASTGFALMSFYFVGRARGRAKAASAGLAAGLIAGLALGSARMMQGAHFLSHTLWSGLVCWTVILLLSILVLRSRAYT